MRKTNWKKVNEVLEEVLAVESSERQDYLKNADIDKNILEEVESLLTFEEAAESSMNLSAVEFSKDFIDDEKDNPLIGQEIGVYKIERELGYGGMGAVYLASRTDGKFEQRVALKLLKREMNTAALRRRFQMEREILASLEHPNIARLLNAGATEDKIPYIAMEYVEGLQIDDYCNKYNLGLDQRLNLFRKVCSAVDFAHRNLIVHRDLKPSNILVTTDGTPKLLDFGISKILSTDLSKINTATVTKMGVMTPSYASPEQLKNKSVTTATDIYSLGVILFEILSGHRPFEEKEDDIKEIYSAVLESEPPLPSALVDTASKKFKEITEAKTKIESKKKSKPSDVTKGLDEKTEANKTRQTKPLKSNIKSNLLKGDLDNIILKALKKEPERRYSSAENFANDIKRHQEGNPVTARPDTFSYRAGKFVKRNSLAVGAIGLIFLAVAGGLLATLWQAEQARAEAAKAEKTLAFMANVLNFSNPTWQSSNPEKNKNAKVSEALDEALKNIDKDLEDEPEVQAKILFILGNIYIGQGNNAKAEEVLQKSVELFDQVYGINNSKSMQVNVALATSKNGVSKVNEAEEIYKKSINYFRSNLSEDKENTKYIALALSGLGDVYGLKGDFDNSTKMHLEGLKFAEKLQGKERSIISNINVYLAGNRYYQGDQKGALKYLEKAMEITRLQGNAENVEGAELHVSMGMAYNALYDYELAETHSRKGYELYVKNVGKKDINSISALFRLAQLYYDMKKFDESEAMVKEILEYQQELYPKGDLSLAYSKLQLGRIRTKQGKLKEGEKDIREAFQYLSTIFKEPNPDLAAVNIALGLNLKAQERFVEAREALQKSYNSYLKTAGKENINTKAAMRELKSIADKQ